MLPSHPHPRRCQPGRSFIARKPGVGNVEIRGQGRERRGVAVGGADVGQFSPGLRRLLVSCKLGIWPLRMRPCPEPVIPTRGSVEWVTSTAHLADPSRVPVIMPLAWGNAVRKPATLTPFICASTRYRPDSRPQSSGKDFPWRCRRSIQIQIVKDLFGNRGATWISAWSRRSPNATSQP
jgi:hypothetical protein